MMTILERVTAEAADRFGGTVVKSTGDGHLITFDGPTQAIRCADALRDSAETLGIEFRIGIHTGECELVGADIGQLRYTFRRASSDRLEPAQFSFPASCVIWSSARGGF
jgi:class 3 adenylate cyclase